MNIIEDEIQYIIDAKISGNNYNKSKNISYQFIEPVHGLCIDKRELLNGQIQACYRLLKDTIVDSEDDIVLREELTKLSLALDMVKY